MVTNVPVNVFDFIPQGEQEAILNGTSTYDCTNDFKNAIAHIKTYADVTYVRPSLTGPAGLYNFSGPILQAPSTVGPRLEFDIIFNGATFNALDNYDTTKDFINLRYFYEYVISGITFTNFKTVWVIINDTEYKLFDGGRIELKWLGFNNCDYGIRHASESCVMTIANCWNNGVNKQLMSFWHADQVVIRDCFFNWDQSYSGVASPTSDFIAFGTSEVYPNDSWPVGHYPVGRLLVENTMFIPFNSAPSGFDSNAWLGMVSGSLTVRNCHFGPESNNSRPYTVRSSIQGATVTNAYDLIDAGITIEDSSCVTTGRGLIYMQGYYPNYIYIRNIRWNILDYANGPEVQYFVTGDATTLNAKTSVYTSQATRFFSWNFDSSTNQGHQLIPVDPRLTFPRNISNYGMISMEDTTDSINTSGSVTTAYYNLVNRDDYPYSLPLAASIIEVTFQGNMHTSVGPNQYTLNYQGNIEIEINTTAASYSILYTTTYTSAFIGALGAPTFSAVFVNAGDNSEHTSIQISDAAAGNYYIRFKIAAAAGNDWRGTTARFKRII